MLRKALLAFFLSFFCVLSCFPARQLRPPEKVDPGQIIDALRSDEEAIHSAGIYLEFKFRGKGRRFSTDAEVFYKEPDTFTVYFKSSSHLNVFKWVMRRDSVSFYLPDRNQYYLDSYENFSQTKGWEWGVELKDFLNLVIGKNGLVGLSLRFIKKEKNYLVYTSEDEFWERKFWVDYRKNQLTRSEWINKNNDQALAIDYERYKNYDGRKFPAFLQIKIPSERETLRVWFKNRKTNLAISEKRFMLAIPDEARRVWLEQKD